MRVLQAAVAILGMHDPDATDNSHAANLPQGGAPDQPVRHGHLRPPPGAERARRPVPPSTDLSHAANFLYMLTGEKPSRGHDPAFDASLTLYAEHELNASTFTTRVIAATLSDMHSAVAGGVGALKGTLHGGAGEAVMRTLLEIGTLDNVDALRGQGARREAPAHGLRPPRLHRGRSARGHPEGPGRGGLPPVRPGPLVRPGGEAPRARCSATKKLIPNVDFYSAPLFYSIGIPVDLFTPVIAAARIAGWTANLLEQYDDNRLIRPRADYKGPPRRAFVPVEKR